MIRNTIDIINSNNNNNNDNDDATMTVKQTTHSNNYIQKKQKTTHSENNTKKTERGRSWAAEMRAPCFALGSAVAPSAPRMRRLAYITLASVRLYTLARRCVKSIDGPRSHPSSRAAIHGDVRALQAGADIGSSRASGI